ncbi:MAG TPA: hypothetical protein ENJ53_01485 [Phaeodactylibacter sp.]|nr:hypothetical protein [Phaeodactylibacter sp.]
MSKGYNLSGFNLMSVKKIKQTYFTICSAKAMLQRYKKTIQLGSLPMTRCSPMSLALPSSRMSLA